MPGADAIINVARKDTPGVVQITNEQVQLGAMGNNAAVPTGVGTGIVLDNQGHIRAHYHVVRDPQKLLVILANGSKQYPATLVRGDSRSDLAVIQVSGANLPLLALGDSSKLTVGQGWSQWRRRQADIRRFPVSSGATMSRRNCAVGYNSAGSSVPPAGHWRCIPGVDLGSVLTHGEPARWHRELAD